MIIVDDASTDGTDQYLQRAAKEDPRIQFLRLAQNSGRPAGPRSIALDQVKSPYVAFIDSDDLWLPNKLERQLEFMKNGNYPISFHQYRRITTDQNKVGRLIDVPEKVDYQELLKQNVISCMTAMVNVEMTGPIPTVNYWRDDFLMWLNLTKKGFSAYGLKEDLGRYRIHNNSFSKNKMRAAYQTWRLYRDQEKLKWPQVGFVFMAYAWRNLQKHSSF